MAAAVMPFASFMTFMCFKLRKDPLVRRHDATNTPGAAAMRCRSDLVLWLARRAPGGAGAAIRARRLDRGFCRDLLAEGDAPTRQIGRIPHGLAGLRRTGGEP